MLVDQLFELIVDAQAEREVVKDARMGLTQVPCSYEKRVYILLLLFGNVLFIFCPFDFVENSSAGGKEIRKTRSMVNLELTVRTNTIRTES